MNATRMEVPQTAVSPSEAAKRFTKAATTFQQEADKLTASMLKSASLYRDSEQTLKKLTASLQARIQRINEFPVKRSPA